MLHYDRVDVSEGVDTNKTIASKNCTIFHYWCFLKKGFRFQPSAFNGCHDVSY